MGIQGPTLGSGVLIAAGVVIASRPFQWTELGHSYVFNYFYCNKIHRKFRVLAILKYAVQWH